MSLITLQPLALAARVRLRIVVTAVALSAFSTLAAAQIVVKSDDTTFKFGFQGQLWADCTQDPTGAQGYQQNIYLRRARIIMGGDIGKDLSFFVETDDPKLGLTPKNLTSGLLLQDALLEWRPSAVFQLVGGLFIVPFLRNGLQSTLTYITLDVSAISTITNGATQSSALRDTGFEAKGFFLKDHLLYRLGEFAGARDVNGHNPARTAGYVQYDFFTAEKGYLFNGTTLGMQRVLAVDAGVDRQGTYRGVSANIAAALPLNGGDEIAGQFQYVHYDGRTRFPAVSDQNDYLLEAGYYSRRLKTQPFLKFDDQSFVSSADASKDVYRFGAGLNRYLHGQKLKWTLQYLRTSPQNTVSLKASSELTIQLQLSYY